MIGGKITVSFLNIGGKAKGLLFIFLGECLVNHEITVEGISRHCGDKRFEIELKKSRLVDGTNCYVWEDKDFQIPPAVNENLPLTKRWDVEYDRRITLMFELSGNPEHLDTLRIVAIPLSNYEDGQACWINDRNY